MTAYTPEIAHAAAARGASWLDEQCPRWVSEIDVGSLDLGEPQLCILGQTAECLIPAESIVSSPPDFFDVLTYLKRGHTSLWPIDVGFDVPKPTGLAADYQTTTMRYEMLTIAWREIIRERLAVAQP